MPDGTETLPAGFKVAERVSVTTAVAANDWKVIANVAITAMFTIVLPLI